VEPAVSAVASSPLPPEVEETGAPSFEYPLAAALALMPAALLTPEGTAYQGQETCRVVVPDLFDQLRRGRVMVPVGMLAACLPPALLTAAAKDTWDQGVRLSLAHAVTGLGMQAFAGRTPVRLHEYDIALMADPFPEPEVLPKLERTPRRAQEPGAAAATEAGAVTEGAVMDAGRVMDYTPVAASESDMDYYELPGNVNVNAALPEELLSLPGMDAALAEALMAWRDKHKGFRSIFDLLKVPGLSPARFRQMTGLQAEQKRYHRRKRIAGLLKIPASKVTDLALVAAAIAGKQGFAGCVITDRDGGILAAQGAEEWTMDFCSVWPELWNRMRHCFELLGDRTADLVSFHAGLRIYSVVLHPNVTLTVVHEASALAANDMIFLRKVSKELAWLLSLRVYVGPRV